MKSNSKMVEAKTFNKELSDRLLSMYRETHNNEINVGSKDYQKLVNMHKVELESIIDNYGWPGSELVGSKGEFAVCLIKEYYSPKDEFYKKCLGLLEKDAEKDEILKVQLSYLK